jgi:hypothetical protein
LLPSAALRDIIVQHRRAISGRYAAATCRSIERKETTMTRKTILIGGVLSALALAVASPALLADTPYGAVTAAASSAIPAHFGGWHHRGPRGGGGFRQHLCSGRHGERMDSFVALVESFVDFTPEQGAAWQQLVAAARASSGSIGEACAELADAGVPTAATDKLARIETMLTTGLDIVQRLRPKFDDFYATLNDDQKKAIDDLMSHRGRHQ